MKRLFTILIALVLVLSMSVSAFAAEGSVNGQGIGEQTIDVTANYQTGGTEPVYSVDITWESMTFTYTDSGVKVWNPSTHTYSVNTSGGWDKTTANITVTNHSNVDVAVAVTYASVQQDTGISGRITGGSKTLAAGQENKPNEADSMTATLTISGKPNSTVTETGVNIGTITIKIS